MKTLYLTDNSNNIFFDKETDQVGSLVNEDRYDIRSIYYIEEPMHVVYQSGEVKEEIDAKKGEILILFFNNRFNKYHLDTIRTKQWVANIKNRRTIEQKEKEEWAARNASNTCDCKCECPTEATPFGDPTAVVPLNENAKKTLEKIKKAVKKVSKK